MLYFILAALIVVLDQLFKYWITLNLSSGGQLALIPRIIHLTYEKNTGAAFSIMEDMRWVLVAIAVILIIIVIVVMFKYKMGTVGFISLAAVLGGAFGNLIDRVFRGYVIDMFATDFINFAIFNIADIFITVGGIVFCIYYITNSGIKTKLPQKEHRKSTLSPADEELNVEWTETKILEDYELERLLSEDDRDNNHR